MRSLLYFSLFSALLLLNCRGEESGSIPQHVLDLPNVMVFPAHTKPVTSIRLARETIFSDSLLPDEIPSVAVDDSGNVYFAGKSWKRRNIHVFEPDGSYRQPIGKYGEGEGEFLEISGIQIRTGRLFVFDDELRRATVFETGSGEYLETIDLTPQKTEQPDNQGLTEWTPVWARYDGTFLVRFREKKNPAYYPDRTLRYFTMNGDQEILSDELLEQRDTQYLIGDYAGRPAPFTLAMPERSLLAVSEQDELHSVWTGEFLIKVFDTEGNDLRAYYHPFERSELKRDEVIHPRFSHNVQLRRIRETAEYPKLWPALYSMLVDDKNRIWVSMIIDDEEVFEWWVIDSHALFAKFNWPREKPITHIKNGFVYTVEADSAGFKEVVRYRVEVD